MGWGARGIEPWQSDKLRLGAVSKEKSNLVLKVALLDPAKGFNKGHLYMQEKDGMIKVG